MEEEPGAPDRLPFAELRRRWPIPATLNLALVATWASAAIGLLFLASSGGWTLAVAAAVAFSFVMQLGFSLVHEAEHDKLHPDRRVNDACGWLLAAMFPGSYAFMRGAHLLHHRRNRADAELVDYVRPSESATVKAMQYYALVCGLVWVGVPLISLAIALLPRGVVRLRPTTSSSAAEYLNALLALSPWRVRAEVGLAVALWAGLFALGLDPLRVGLCYAAFAFSWSSQQYVYHVRSPRHLVDGAFDLALWAPMSWLYLKFNHHRAHHRDVRVPWLYMDQLEPVAPTQGYLATYLALWAPPRPVGEAWPPELVRRGPLPARGTERG